MSAAARHSFGSPANSGGVPWLCEPASRRGCPCQEDLLWCTDCIGSHRQRLEPNARPAGRTGSVREISLRAALAVSTVAAALERTSASRSSAVAREAPPAVLTLSRRAEVQGAISGCSPMRSGWRIARLAVQPPAQLREAFRHAYVSVGRPRRPGEAAARRRSSCTSRGTAISPWRDGRAPKRIGRGGGASAPAKSSGCYPDASVLLERHGACDHGVSRQPRSGDLGPRRDR